MLRPPALALFAALVATLPAAAQPPSPAPAPAPSPPPRALTLPSTTFQVVLLIAETAGTSRLEGVSPRAEKALRDIQEFLPYRSYRLVDQAWLRTDHRAETTATGPGGEPLEITVAVEPAGLLDAGALRVAEFRLVSRPPGEGPKMLLKSSFQLELGETIVVGTSKLDGPNKALVVLLSALP